MIPRAYLFYLLGCLLASAAGAVEPVSDYNVSLEDVDFPELSFHQEFDPFTLDVVGRLKSWRDSWLQAGTLAGRSNANQLDILIDVYEVEDHKCNPDYYNELIKGSDRIAQLRLYLSDRAAVLKARCRVRFLADIERIGLGMNYNARKLAKSMSKQQSLEKNILDYMWKAGGLKREVLGDYNGFVDGYISTVFEACWLINKEFDKYSFIGDEEYEATGSKPNWIKAATECRKSTAEGVDFLRRLFDECRRIDNVSRAFIPGGPPE